MAHTNGTRHVLLRPGIYAPTMTFFDPETEDLDIPTIRKHAVRLAKAGLVGLVTMGSNGEAVHLDRSERMQVTRATREALDEAGFQNVPVIAGAAEQSVRGTLSLIREAAQAGADHVLLVPPSYFRPAMTDDVLYDYYTTVADASPLPILLYNYPGAVAGIDMSSDLIIRISRHSNIVGTKFTCGNTGKLTRVAAALDAASVKNAGSGYMAFGGFADFTVQTLASGGSGIIAGCANVFPKTAVRVWNLWSQGKIDEAIKLQTLVSQGDWITTKGGVAGTKAALQLYFGYGGYPRRPLARLSEEKTKQLGEDLADIMKYEAGL
ncbi:aldolase [Xylona heveae TC161]|uniref:Aldolase n=1 Tax=Xylona heveae (strain CBS 132557 / TC161) TaxID=1328760 RepID=A0A165HHA4_XYLHT|nr:aldolase [Xylona heveae TC161]KZF23514.1 aldolase [Xylona heveae TC161]